MLNMELYGSQIISMLTFSQSNFVGFVHPQPSSANVTIVYYSKLTFQEFLYTVVSHLDYIPVASDGQNFYYLSSIQHSASRVSTLR